MRLTLHSVAVVGVAMVALSSVAATVVAFPVPPVRDDAQLLRASALDKGYGINNFDAETDCHLIQLETVDGYGNTHPNIVQQCD